MVRLIKATATYGYGGYLFTGTEKIVLQGNGCDPEMAAMRNVAGEILGSRAAIEKSFGTRHRKTVGIL